ncbi:unnamed protein product [Polarella glacialis]|uniref:Uncharacterized protein n=1 Tax=Polarella glacialis TaxID=89957 RepID=A0A813FK46_POLGL|nr:unnamed protein product [Polarella glacialis]
MRARSPFRKAGSRSSSRAPSGSPDGNVELPVAPVEDPDDTTSSVQRYTEFVEMMQLRLQTTQVECENLRRQIQDLRRAAGEPVLGTAPLRQTLAALEQDNQQMHAKAEQNRQVRAEVDRKQAEVAELRASLGLEAEQRPGTSSRRPGSGARPRTAQAAVEAVLSLTSQQPTTAEGFRAHMAALRRELERERERTSELRASACSAVLGRNISPPPTSRAMR